VSAAVDVTAPSATALHLAAARKAGAEFFFTLDLRDAAP
jgi:hypothetical protein